MKKLISFFGFIVLTGTITTIAARAESNTNGQRHSAEHNVAIKKCDSDYKEEMKSARLLRGKERSEAERKAKAYRTKCYAEAPN
jgi:hypothetical protein